MCTEELNMDRIIEEEIWNYVCFEKGEDVFLTYMVQHGPATVDYTVRLSANEANSVKQGHTSAKSMLDSFDASRFVKPSLWPSK